MFERCVSKKCATGREFWKINGVKIPFAPASSGSETTVDVFPTNCCIPPPETKECTPKLWRIFLLKNLFSGFLEQLWFDFVCPVPEFNSVESSLFENWSEKR